MPSYFEFDVALREIRPRIWRRFLLHQQATFQDLHDAIQDAFGWTDSHLWEFSRAEKRGAPIAASRGDELTADWRSDDEDVPDPADIRLASFFTPRGPKKCRYLYDFGDRWDHVVALRRRVELPEPFGRRLLDGARACPPEDCGGVPGYAACCAFVATGKHPWQDAGEFAEWLGDWRPGAFDLEAAKRDFDRAAR